MLENFWYPILEAKQLKKKPQTLLRLNQSWTLWRNAENEPVAFPSFCPHRGADLGQGKVSDGHLECPWHGFGFASDGTCIKTPCQGPDAKVPQTLHIQPATIRSAHGLIWMWHGERREDYPDIPFFDDVTLEAHRSSEMSYVLPHHYTRMVEANLDMHHTPFVHKWSVPGLGAIVRDFHARLEGNRIYTSGQLCRSDQSEGMVFRADVILPNLGMIELTDKLRLLVASTPVDDSHTWLWFRYYQDYSNLPGVRRAISWLAVQSELRVVQKQDWRIFSGFAPGSIDDVDYHLVRADLGIALYHKRRRELLDSTRRAAAHG
ncbi:MAG: Rieske 2Fe-2S domain-containing protein [Gammaproteobacteria bacterium]|nr:Rieske 2Fe-2S domain-containing protein [Gammaproteobacteria bacterium]